ncbi:hypothetical protein DYB34_000213 [Aphanomyces astaci]|uniref:Hexose transporter 1 n=2 Tax=Aphanomyces astaci TaxID=112090 RepID=A0A418BZ41_APHAT|nr:hypothetical protein DYB34_000213 [Aphanomyces astaci]
MQHSQSAVTLGANKGSWADIKKEEGMRKRSNTAQNLQFYVEEQKRLYHELPFMALPGMRRQSFQRERSFSNIKSKSSWGSFTNLVSQGQGEGQALLGEPRGEPGYTLPLLLSCCVALVSAFQFGYNIGVTGALNTDFIFPEAVKSVSQKNLEWSIVVSIFAIGGPIGSLVAGQISQTYGRKKALIFDSFLFILAGGLMAFANNIYWLMAGRFLVGFAAGTVSVVVPLYLGELAPPNLRGALGTGYQFGVVLGILAADLLAFGFSDVSDGFARPGWRFMFGFTAIPALLQLALASFLTESPRWLLTQNKPKEAAEILRRLRGTTDVYEEIDSICSASDNESSDMTVWEVLSGTIRFPLIVGISLQIAQQLSGINAVMFYANSFFKGVHLSNPLVGATLVGAINVVSTGVALVLMDTAGRRPLLLWSCGGMIVSCVILTLGLWHMLPYYDMVSVGGVMLFVWFFEIGLGPIPWLIVAEMFPAKPRPTAMSVATMVNWMFSFVVGIAFPTMQSSLLENTFVPFAIVLVIAFVFVYKYVPETKGKTLEEIQQDMTKMPRGSVRGHLLHEGIHVDVMSRYFTILTQGCGNSSCTNAVCRSNPAAVELNATDAAIQSIALAVTSPVAICLSLRPSPVTPTQHHATVSPPLLQLEVPETDDDDKAAAPSTPRKRLATAVQLDSSINLPSHPRQARSVPKKVASSSIVVGKGKPLRSAVSRAAVDEA